MTPEQIAERSRQIAEWFFLEHGGNMMCMSHVRAETKLRCQIEALAREAADSSRKHQVALDLPAALSEAESRAHLEGIIDRMLSDRIDQGLVALGGEGGHARIAAPSGHVLDDAGKLWKVSEAAGWQRTHCGSLHSWRITLSRIDRPAAQGARA